MRLPQVKRENGQDSGGCCPVSLDLARRHTVEVASQERCKPLGTQAPVIMLCGGGDEGCWVHATAEVAGAVLRCGHLDRGRRALWSS